jgi:DNA-binding GntR family transcriptional regulator
MGQPIAMVRTMSSGLLRHREVREAIASRIASGDLAPGDRLPSERDLQEEFSCARSVIRQALAALARDGWILSSNQRGYTILGPRIPWISRLRLLSDEPWTLTIDKVHQDVAPDDIAEALAIPTRSPVIVRESHTSASASGERWSAGTSYYPTEGLGTNATAILMTRAEINYDDIEAAYGRRVLGYHEIIRARTPTDAETRALEVSDRQPLIEVRRTSRTTSSPVSAFVFIGRADRFEADYLIQA